MKTISMNVEGMSCGHCQARVKKALESVEGVTAVNVDLIQKTATVEASEAVDQTLLKQSVEKIGFVVGTIN